MKNIIESKYLHVYLSNNGNIAIKQRASLEVMNEDYMGKVKFKDLMESFRKILEIPKDSI